VVLPDRTDPGQIADNDLPAPRIVNLRDKADIGHGRAVPVDNAPDVGRDLA
jgi:hypothetical protein